MLQDRYGRVHDYLRIALTDACNLRCVYCMPDEKTPCLPSNRLMSVAEVDTLARVFVQNGVRKIRLTGGEPLVRKEAREIIERLATYPVELTLTTNGVLADEFLDTFLRAGIHSLNVSMDSLRPDAFFSITKRDYGERVRQNIMLLLEAGLHVKLNTVVMRGVNDHEVPHFVELTRYLPLHVRFIEFMPFHGNQWEHQKVVPSAELLERIAEDFEFVKLHDGPHDTAKKFTVLNHAGTFALISTMSAHFCAGCNRLRLTADGKMKNCLFSKNETDLLGPLRNGLDVEPLIRDCLSQKAPELGGQLQPNYQLIDATELQNRSMIAIGG
ncbi:MAG: GTP 3',8-cyclase MoaA [Saprospiraceae bacterium]